MAKTQVIGDGDDLGDQQRRLPPSSRPSGLPVGHVVDGPGGEHAGEDGAQRSAHAVHAEGVERVVVPNSRFSDVQARKQTTPAATPISRAGIGCHEAGGGRDADQAGHHARARAQARSACRG